MTLGLYLKLDQDKLVHGDFSDTDKITGTIYTDEAKSSAKNLTGYTLDIILFKEGGSAAFDKTASIVTAADGTFSYAVAEGELPAVGIYNVEVELSQSGQRISTFPEEILVSRSPTS